MKKYIVLFVIVLQFLNINSLTSQDLEIKFPVVNLEFTGEYDSTTIRIINYRNSVAVGLMANLFCFQTLNNEYIFANILRSGDTLSIFNASTNNINSIYIPNSFYIEHLYFHNYDSIFLFFERQIVFSQQMKGQKMADFYLTDTTGVIKELFSLDSVPYIYKGSYDTMIYLRRYPFEGNKIIDNILYLPFSIYNPSISDSLLRTLKMRLLCAYDIENKKVKMLNINMPDKEIGTLFNEDVFKSGFDFLILNDSILIYSFDYSSDLFNYNINKDTINFVKKFPNFFENIPNPTRECHYTHYSKMKFSSIENVFIRDLSIYDFENFEDFQISQILDENFNLVGYFVEDSIYEYMDVNANGELVVLNKKKNTEATK